MTKVNFPNFKSFAAFLVLFGESAFAEEILVRDPPPAVRRTFRLPSFYQQWVDVEGFPVVASKNVSPYAIKEAAWLIRRLIGHRTDVLQAMAQNRVRFSVMAHHEMTTDIPEYSDMRPGFYWDRRTRGLGPTPERPSVSCGEENLLNFQGDPYMTENILIHEFAHAIHLMGLNAVDNSFDERLMETFEKTRSSGLWNGTYASSNKEEYWAEGVQSWFDTNREDDSEHNHVNTREELKKYDPALAVLIADVLGETDWRYTRPAMRTHLPHLNGFDLQVLPEFSWPTDLDALYSQLFDSQGDGGEKWINLDPKDPGELSRLRSPGSKTESTEVLFVNRGTETTYHWVASDGTQRYFGRLAPFDGFNIQLTFSGHIWLIKGQNGKNISVFQADERTGRVYIGPMTLAKISGENQEGAAGSQLAEPLVVSVLDQSGFPSARIPVKFAVIGGGGSLSIYSTTTNSGGHAATLLTLGDNPGTNTVEVRVRPLKPQSFVAMGHAIADSLAKVSGFGQNGMVGTTLAKPFVVLVRDQNGNPFAGAAVTFTVTSGSGTLSVESVTTDANGRASTTLTLGNEVGQVAITATVADLDPVTFAATVNPSPDFDGDGSVGFSDFVLFAALFGMSESDGEFHARFDLDENGAIGFSDFVIFARAFGTQINAVNP